MVKAKYSELIAELRGSSGGAVFSANKSGPYIKTKVVPLYSNTPAQQQRRNIITNLSPSFNELTIEQKAAWKQFGIDNPKPDIFGIPRPQSAQNAYISINTPILYAGQPKLPDPPLDTTTSQVTYSAIEAKLDITTNKPQIYIVGADDVFTNANQICNIYTTNNIPENRAVLDSDYSLAGVVGPSSATEFYLMISNTRFFWKIGTRVYIKLVTIDKRNGIPSTPIIITDVVDEK
jgi:hypothetical protein